MIRPIVIAAGAAVGTGGLTDLLGADAPLAGAFALVVGVLVWLVKSQHAAAERREIAADKRHADELQAWTNANDADRATFSAGFDRLADKINETGCRWRE